MKKRRKNRKKRQKKVPKWAQLIADLRGILDRVAWLQEQIYRNQNTMLQMYADGYNVKNCIEALERTIQEAMVMSNHMDMLYRHLNIADFNRRLRRKKKPKATE